ncbi:MAG: DEAD/DEAH box helicase family protein, partial [Desulfobacterales bacterium]|nr:DEAD/DEAH box helicase family protein [Desulfobacterales bacterium]
MKIRPRRHQLEMMSIVDEIRAGADIRKILAYVEPGGGKSALPLIMGTLIPAGFADAICWICPRKTLQYQAESNFQDRTFRRMFGHKLSIRVSTNDENPTRDLDGFSTSYQSLGVDNKQTVLREIQSKRYILVADEFHHAEIESLWAGALEPIIKAAKYLLLLSGTMERNSGNKIAFTDYIKTEAGIQPDLEPSRGDSRTIVYSRSDALAEKAIIPLKFTFTDASAEWEEADGKRRKYASVANVPEKDTGKYIWSAISTEFAEQTIDQALLDWEDHKKINPTAKMLIVTANISRAKAAIKHLKNRFYSSAIATSEETKAALTAMKQLKRGDIEILVGVAMFSEGYDEPSISHIVLLTNVRSVPWIIQLLARSVRVNRSLPYNKQYGHIFSLDDPHMR